MDSLYHNHNTASKVEVTLTDAVENVDAVHPEVDACPNTANTTEKHTETTPTRAGSAKYVLMATNNRLTSRT